VRAKRSFGPWKIVILSGIANPSKTERLASGRPPDSDVARVYAQAPDPGLDMTVSYVRKLPREAPPGTLSRRANIAFVGTRPALSRDAAKRISRSVAHADYSYAVQNGTFSITTVPGKPGEVITLWGTGFGPTAPAAPSGQVVPPGSYTVSGVTVTLGGQLGTALTSGLAGLYQIAIHLPSNLPSGDYEVVTRVRGSVSPASALITVLQ
jgi:uncharacterized protein (TIGR03437 family)